MRVYHGSAARLPKHYVSRQRLCLRATTDYWVNAMDGRPFFVVHRPVDPGLLKVLEEEIVPRLEKEVPHPPSAEQLAADPKLDKFILVFDREGYSPEGLKKKAALQREIQELQVQLQTHKAQRAEVAHHLPLGQVPEAERFDRLSNGSKDLVDTIKLVAYRAETAMAHVMREALPQWRQEEERRRLQSLYASEADLIPNQAAGTLTVRLHYPANPILARAIEQLCTELTATETVFPTTKLRLVYQLADGDAKVVAG